MTHVNDIAREAGRINDANGWDRLESEDWPQPYHTPREEVRGIRKICTALALVHTEVSEATEAVRKRNLGNFGEELADVVIRVFDIADGMEIDILEEILAKLEKNRHRGPRHGGKPI